MLIFDQLRKHDPRLRIIALAFVAGFVVLFGGLWWVQIVSSREYKANLEMQSFRTVRIPAVRGKILDRNGEVLAENRPTYNVSLYPEELRKPFETAYSAEVSGARADLKQQQTAEEKKLGRKLKKDERKKFLLTRKDREALRQAAHCQVASNVVAQVSQRLGQPLSLDLPGFLRHCSNSLALPFPIATNLTPLQIARFQEQATTRMGVDIEMQSTRIYPHQATAAHVLGSVKRDLDSVEGEESYFSYRLPGYRGQVGIEAAFDEELRGKAGAKSILVNSVGVRQAENVWSQAEPGTNVILTIDIYLQEAAEHALPVFGPNTRGAIVLMDVQTGDILAMASSPTVNPNHAVQGYPPGELARRHDPGLRPEINRATQENYAPGSIFKTVVGLACLEAGLDPNEIIDNPGYIFVGKRHIKDLAAPGRYNFHTALIHSSNTYFIANGLRYHIENIIRIGHALHLGESTGLRTRQESAGIFPNLKRVSSDWFDGDTANICIGQGKMSVTPLQMAVMTAAIASGGKVLWPRLVDRIEPQIPTGDSIHFESGRVRDDLGVKAKNLQTVREAMLADVEDAGGTGTAAAVPGMRICAKTGTAQVQDARGNTIADTVWIASFAPYEKPRYALVVMVEVERNGGSGGKTCAPIAAKMYKAIQKREQMGTTKQPALADTK